MKVSATPSPFPRADGFHVNVTGGTPPYTFTPGPVPPNPAGVTITPDEGGAHVDVPEDTPPQTGVVVIVSDSSTPPQVVPVADMSM